MLAKFDDERAGAGIPLPEGQAVTLGRAHIPAGIVAPLHRTQVSRQHVRLTRQGRVVHIEVVRGRRFEAALPALVHADPPQVSATHAVLVQWQGADHASWQKLDPQGKGQLTVGDRFALHPGVDRPVAFRLVDAAEGAQTPSIGASARLRAEAAAREGLSASVEGSQAPTPGVGGLAEKRPRRDAPEGTGSSLPGSGPGEESPPPRRRRKVTFHPDASVAGAASQDGTARLRDASAPPPPQPAPAPAAGGGEGDGGALAPARADVTTRPGVLAPGAALAAAVPAHTPPLGSSETADGSSPPSAAAPAAEATRPALSEAAVPAWGGGRGTEVLEGRRRTAQGDEVHATVLVEGASVPPLSCAAQALTHVAAAARSGSAY